MDLSKLLGPSWKTSLGGIVFFLGGLGALVAQAGFGDTKWGKIIVAISSGASLLGASFGLASAKDASVTGIGNKATSDPSKDATVPPPWFNQKP